MNKLLALAAVFCLAFLPGYAAPEMRQKADSMLRLLPAQKDDTNKVNLLYEIGIALWEDSTQSLKYANMCLQVANKIKWDKGAGMAYSIIAGKYDEANDAKNALVYHEKALGAFLKCGSKPSILVQLGAVGNIYDNISNYPKALEYFFKALKLSEELNDKNRIARSLNNIGVVYREMSDYTQALQYYFKALKIRKERGDSLVMASLYCNISSAYAEKANDSEALRYNTMALGIYSRKQDKHGLMITNQSRAVIYEYIKKYDSSLACIRLALTLAEELGDIAALSENNFNIGYTYYVIANDTGDVAGNLKRLQVYNKDEAYKIAREYILKGKELFLKTGNLEGAMEAARIEGEIDEYFADYEGALANHKQYMQLKDSIFSASNTERIAALETDRALLVKDKQIQEDNRKSRERIFFVSITGLLLLVIALVAYSFIRQRKLTTQKTALANEKEGLLQEKNMLIKEIHHRVKNNLQVVVSLLDLQTGSTDNLIAKETMTEGAARVKSISLIHKFLYQNDDVTTIEYANFVRELFAQVSALFKLADQGTVLQEQIPETNLDIDTAVPLGLIVNELMINSFKHAFPRIDGTINIVLKPINNGYELTYSDSGKGLPDDYNIKAATTMGMTIMRSLSRQIGGTFSYSPEQNTFTVMFKDKMNRKKAM